MEPERNVRELPSEPRLHLSGLRDAEVRQSQLVAVLRDVQQPGRRDRTQRPQVVCRPLRRSQVAPVFAEVLAVARAREVEREVEEQSAVVAMTLRPHVGFVEQEEPLPLALLGEPTREEMVRSDVADRGHVARQRVAVARHRVVAPQARRRGYVVAQVRRPAVVGDRTEEAYELVHEVLRTVRGAVEMPKRKEAVQVLVRVGLRAVRQRRVTFTFPCHLNGVEPLEPNGQTPDQ